MIIISILQMRKLRQRVAQGHLVRRVVGIWFFVFVCLFFFLVIYLFIETERKGERENPKWAPC